MILKWIKCQVPEVRRQAFVSAQQAWQALETVEGFCGQIGGWNLNSPAEVCILGLWTDDDTYRRFMSHVHDRISHANRQDKTYATIDVLLLDVLIDIPGTCALITAALADGRLLRVADCTLKPNRNDHFIEMQKTLWNPAMAQTGGMLAGAFGSVQGQPQHFLTCTLWRDEAVHQRYVDTDLPSLRHRADLEEDLHLMSGHLVRLEPAWRVMPKRVD